MTKLSDAMIDSIPGLKAARDNGNITFLNLDTDDTSPTITEGFSDDDLKNMSESALQTQLAQINDEEQRIVVMQQDLVRRRNSMLAIMKRRAELS